MKNFGTQPSGGPTPIRSLDVRLIDELFGMSGGYVLDFSDRTFAEFFDSELGVNIDNPYFSSEGTSKARRLRYFLKISNPATRVSTLRSLWEYREAIRRSRGDPEKIPDAERLFQELLGRISGGPQSERTSASPPAASNPPRIISKDLHRKLLALISLPPHQRGFEYERFLKHLFDANGLAGRASFRLVGEQIDGSFVFEGANYLLEAKWQGAPVGAADLRSFNAKVEDKAAWSRGLFVSNSGFSDDGLTAFGRGKRLVCMDGLDLNDLLERGIGFTEVLARKVRHAAESGSPFARVRDLFPD